MSVVRYPDTPVNLAKRYEQPDRLSFQQGDNDWDQIEYALNIIRPIIKAIKDNGGIDIVINGSAKTGDAKVSFSSVVEPGWILCDGRTMGSDSSGANLLGSAYSPLFSVIWAFAANEDLLTSAGGPTTKGASADADWNANKRLYLPAVMGRVLCCAGQGSGLTNRVLGAKFGGESGVIPHTHTVSAVTVAPHTEIISLTASATISNFVGSVTPTITVTVDPIPYSLNPSGTITINPFTVTGIVVVNDITVDFSNADPHTDTILEAAPGHIHQVDLPGEPTGVPAETPVERVPPDLYDSEPTIVTIDLATQPLNHSGTQIIPITAVFTADQTAATGTVAIDPLTGDLSATASATSSAVSLNHGHTATVTVDPYELNLPHVVGGNTDSASPSYSTLQPSFVVNLLIKL